MATPPLRPNLDAVTTIRDDGSRPFLYPSDTKGRFTQARRWSAFALIAFYLSLPWITINGYPAVFLDVAERRFHLFGITGAAQDLWLMFFVITGLGFSLFFVTALLGRVWCGWACPHTVFLDHVYRRIERLIEGDALKRRALAAAPFSAGKFFKVGLKHTLYIIVSAVITHLLLAYFVSLPEVWAMVRAAPTEHWGAFGFIAVATSALYFNFAWFREQLCIVVCPYGRIQSALIDDNSLVVGYDVKRGEPRGKTGTVGAGDCISCSRCVQVCPTGIDIRNGLQYECISCSACIDVCDAVMDKMHYPRGLIRNSTENGMAQHLSQSQMLRRVLRPRVLVYAAVLGAITAGMLWSLLVRANFKVDVQRDRGSVARMVGQGMTENVYRLQIMNATEQAQTYAVGVTGLEGAQVAPDAAVTVDAASSRWVPVRVQAPAGIAAGSHQIAFVIVSQATPSTPAGEVLEKSVFLVPR